MLEAAHITNLTLPGGTTPFIQPVDCSIGKLVKEHVRACFKKWCVENVDEITRPDGRRTLFSIEIPLFFFFTNFFGKVKFLKCQIFLIS